MEHHQSISSFFKRPMERVGGDSTVTQVKAGLSECIEARTDGLLLTQRSLQEEAVKLDMQQKPADSGVATHEDCGGVSPSPLTPQLDTPTSPLFLVEGLESLGLSESGPGLFSSLQSQMERQLLVSPEMMHRVLGSDFVQSALSSASPELTRALILSNPQIQQLLQTNPELTEEIHNLDVITKVLELVRNPDLVKDVLKSEDCEFAHSQAKQYHHCFTFSQKTVNSKQTKSPHRLSKLNTTSKAEISPQSTDTGLQSLLEQVSSSPGLMESLLSGPYVSSLLQCLSRNPELAAQMLLSQPLLSENPQLQQHLRQQLPLLLEQMQSPELLSAMLNPKAVEALLQIQQGLQTLATEAPALIPGAAFGTSENPAESVPNKPQGGPTVATATEQQQHFVQQMLQALANSDHKDLDGVSCAFEDRSA